MAAAIGLAVKEPWLTPGGTTLPDRMNELRKHYSHLVGRVHFWQFGY